MARVSIYLSSYNHARYLGESIDSVLRQSFTDFELFILDDASTDASWEIIQGQSDPRIRALRNPVNRNDKQEMNRIIRDLATGDLIAVQHSDNVWEPDKLQRQVEFLDAHAEVGAVFTNARIIDENGAPFKDRRHFYATIFDQPNRNRQAWLNRFFLRGNALCHPSVLIRRQCYDECGYYRNGLAQIADLDLWVRVCMKYEIHVLPEKLVRFRVQSDESHSSGDRPAVHVRESIELLHVLDHYRAITNFEELVKIFPEAEVHRRLAGSDTGYALGRLALAASPASPALQLFGLNLLFEAINDPRRAANVTELYGFTHRDFIALTGEHDPFAIERPRRDIAGMWKATLFLIRLRDVLFPVGSFQYRLLRPVYRFIMSALRLR